MWLQARPLVCLYFQRLALFDHLCSFPMNHCELHLGHREEVVMEAFQIPKSEEEKVLLQIICAQNAREEGTESQRKKWHVLCLF